MSGPPTLEEAPGEADNPEAFSLPRLPAGSDDALKEVQVEAHGLGLPPDEVEALGTGESLAPAARKALADLELRTRN